MQEAITHLNTANLLKLARKRAPNMDRETVCRTIELLKRLVMIDKFDLIRLDSEKHYCEVQTRQEHLHLASFGCGEIREFATPTFERPTQEIGMKNDFQIQVVRLEVGELCSELRKRKPSAIAA
jgi:Fur family transcriptional regulator, ferric uptake regulator